MMKPSKPDLAVYRSVAIHALRVAFPKATSLAIGRALGMNHSAVLYHWTGQYKGGSPGMVPVTTADYARSAMAQVKTGNLLLAAEEFEALAKHLREMAK